ncbi:nucleoside deaminase [Anaplasma phagocytophilum]|uniref:nucleoside deaminase n=1 Tax=Anaplasma phagocytophilum TaxID=948 RepID=UPI00201B0624
MRAAAYMKIAMKEANSSFGEIPVGAVVVLDGVIIAKAHNLTIQNTDPTAHAEIVAIRMACKALSTHILDSCDIYVTLEPCAMCTQAISLARIRRIYFGAYNEKLGGIENGARVLKYCLHVPEVYGGFLEQENAKLLKAFFKKMRPKN